MTFLLITGAGCQNKEEIQDTTKSVDIPDNQEQTNVQWTPTYTIKIKNFKFEPENLIIKEGSIVNFVNEDSSAHTATANNNEFDSGILQQGDTYIHPFTKQGDFSYFCEIHPSMKGNIKVE
jgi:plastocyanin